MPGKNGIGGDLQNGFRAKEKSRAARIVQQSGVVRVPAAYSVYLRSRRAASDCLQPRETHPHVPNPLDTITAFEAFNEDEFFEYFPKDLDAATEDGVLRSPFFAENRMTKVLPAIIRFTKRGLPLCIFLREPDFWARRNDPTLPAEIHSELERAKEQIAKLERAGAHVNLRPKIHEKLFIADRRIVWDGSLNTLSHRNTSERMTRLVSRHFAIQAIVKHGLDRCHICYMTRLRTSFSELNAEAQLDLIRQTLWAARRTTISQTALADLLGRPQNFVSRFESKGSDPSSQTLLHIAGILGYELVPVPKALVPAVEWLVFDRLCPKKK